MRSALYRGRVRHRRVLPRPRAFEYRVFQLYLDLDELDRVFAGRLLWSVERPNIASFRRRDYLRGPRGDTRVPLKQAVLDVAEESLGRRPAGPVRMLTHLRYWGLCFNPVTFYWCFREDGETLDALVAEITNTPWNERHRYVLDADTAERRGDALRWTFDKTFHVSPFMPMEQEYRWSFTPVGERLVVHMENHADGELQFDATLSLARRPITGRTLAAALASHPWMTAKALLGIYGQAARLWLGRTPFHSHPKHLVQPTPSGDPS